MNLNIEKEERFLFISQDPGLNLKKFFKDIIKRTSEIELPKIKI